MHQLHSLNRFLKLRALIFWSELGICVFYFLLELPVQLLDLIDSFRIGFEALHQGIVESFHFRKMLFHELIKSDMLIDIFSIFRRHF